MSLIITRRIFHLKSTRSRAYTCPCVYTWARVCMRVHVGMCVHVGTCVLKPCFVLSQIYLFMFHGPWFLPYIFIFFLSPFFYCLHRIMLMSEALGWNVLVFLLARAEGGFFLVFGNSGSKCTDLRGNPRVPQGRSLCSCAHIHTVQCGATSPR